MTSKHAHLASIDATLRALVLEGMHGVELGTWAWHRNPLCAAAAAIASWHGEGRVQALRDARWFSTEVVFCHRLSSRELVGDLMFDKKGRSGAYQVGLYLYESNRIDVSRALQVLNFRIRRLWADRARGKRPDLVGSAADLPEQVDERAEPAVAEVITAAILDPCDDLGSLLRGYLEEVVATEHGRRRDAKPVMQSYLKELGEGRLPSCRDLADAYGMSRTAVYQRHFTQALCSFAHRAGQDADFRARVRDLLLERGCSREQAEGWLCPRLFGWAHQAFVVGTDPDAGDKVAPRPWQRGF